MPPVVALLLAVFGVLWLLAWDAKHAQGTTKAIWVPLTWLLIISSRFVSEWLGGWAPTQGGLVEGSPLDSAIFGALIAAAALILFRRRLRVRHVVWINAAVVLFLAYAAISIAWSDFPWVALKRWVKVLGHPMMVLVVLSEPNQREAVRVLFTRVGYVLIPASVLLIKYFPELGRGFSEWTGVAYNTGVTTNKNALGVLCLIVGLYFVWNIFIAQREGVTPRRRFELVSGLTILGMTAWLLNLADSATSLLSLLIGLSVLFVLGIDSVRRGWLTLYIACGVAFLAFLDTSVDLQAVVVHALGRDSTLTDRTELWRDVLSISTNPYFGRGFESFWLGDRLTFLWEKWAWRPNQAHNGYLEVYLNSGYLGLVMLCVVFMSCYTKAKGKLRYRADEGRLRMALLVVLLVYNYTEAVFKALHPLFFIFFLISMDAPATAFSRRRQSGGSDGPRNIQTRLSPVPSAVGYSGRSPSPARL